MIEKIIGDETATPWHRAHALYLLIIGAAAADVTEALLQKRPPHDPSA